MTNTMYNNRKHYHLSSLFFLLFSVILLQTTCPDNLTAMNLMEAYTRAKQHDPLFGSSLYEHEAAKTLSAQGRSFILPQIQAYGTESKYHYDSGSILYSDFNSESMGVSIRQPIFNVSRYYEYRQHQIRKNIGNVRFVAAEQDLILRVVEAYINGLEASNLLELIDTEKKAVIEQLEQAKRMFQVGVSTITDVHDAEARYDSVLAKEIEAKNDLDIKMKSFKRIVGVEPDTMNRLKEDVILGIPESDSLEIWIEKAKMNHPMLKAYACQIDYQMAELKKNEGQHWPSVDLVGGYNNTNTNEAVKIPRVSYGIAGVQVNLPIFSGGYTWAKAKEAHAVLGKVNKEYENTLADITLKLSEAFLSIHSNQKKIYALMLANKSASTSLESNRMSLIAGVRTTIDVLNAERELQQVRTRLLKARYDSLLNIVKLKAHAGTLTSNDLLEIDDWLQN